MLLCQQSVRRTFVRAQCVQRRGYPDILTSQERLDTLALVRARMKSDPTRWFRVQDLSVARQAWFRRINTLTGLSTITVAFSSAYIVPKIVLMTGPLPMGICLAVGSIGIMTGSEATKMVADQGLKIAVPAFLAFACLLGFPVHGAFVHFPTSVAIKAVIFSLSSLVTAVTVSHFSPKFTDKLPVMLAPVVAIPLLSSFIFPTESFTELAALAVGSPILSLGAWAATQRQLKLAKHSTGIEDLNERTTNTVALQLGFPLLVFLFVLGCYGLNKKEPQTKEPKEEVNKL
eukprot:TRINITY_DN4693_c0_g1_i2.p1 TRINITY_DN4693_c0_g1~~TRINITY_DN4693_c0_g1_i2.p1  ORF type:complete len:288 (+),score=34.90 TRINITY_DN4693_c0_g1_i2:17-880(+)